MKKLRKPDTTIFDVRTKKLIDFVATQHGAQVRRYTYAPYFYHLIAVATTVLEYTNNGVLVAAACCHDLYEDTSCTEEDLLTFLKQNEYTATECQKINQFVHELTDQYTKTNYPNWNRKQRKKAEAERLWKISSEAQTVKYADMIDNAPDIATHDPGFGQKYLAEMNEILRGMNKGNPTLYKFALKIAQAVAVTLQRS